MLSHFYFSPNLNIGKIVILRSFSDTLEQLNDVSYLTLIWLVSLGADLLEKK